MGVLSSQGIDFVSSALRHVRDAEHLATLGEWQSLDQAWHLAGFGPECIRKACLDRASIRELKKLGHELDEPVEPYLKILISLDPHAARYGLEGFARRHSSFMSWSPESRYMRTGTWRREEVDELVAAARAEVDRIVALLYCEGRLEDIPA